MADNIRISGDQVATATLTPAKLDLATASNDYDFSSCISKAATQDAGTNSTLIATTAFVQQEISELGFTAGAGILKDASTSPDTISVDLKTNAGITMSAAGNSGLLQLVAGNGIAVGSGGIVVSARANYGLLVDSNGIQIDLGSDAGLEFVSGKLEAKVDSVGGIAKISDGLALAIADNKGIILNAGNLEGKPNADKAIEVGANGFGVVTDAAGCIQASSAGLSLNADSAFFQASGNALTIKAASLTVAKVKWQYQYKEFTGSATATFSLDAAVPASIDRSCVAYKNGLRMSYDESASTNNEYAVSGSTVTFGAAVLATDLIQIQYISQA